MNVHKTKHAKITTSYKNNNEGLPKRYYCIKILPERWSVPKSHSSGNRTCLLFPFEDVQLDVGKLAIWRLRTREDFGSTWLSDYIVNNLEECVSEQDEDLEMEMG